MNASNIKLLSQPQTNLGDGYLQFKLNQNTTAVLLVNFTEEVVVLPLGAITAIPNTSELIVGLMNWRNRIIWVVDLPKILGFESQFSQMRQCNIIVIRHEAETIGLMVPEIKGTVRFNSGTIQPAQNQASDIIHYLNGCIRDEDELNLVLNIQAILKSSFLHDK
jgi:twitching motility protein PilI